MGVRVAASSEEEDQPPPPKTTQFHAEKRNPRTPSRRWSNLWLRNPNNHNNTTNALRQVFEAMHLQPFLSSPATKSLHDADDQFLRPPDFDRTLLLPDETLLRILSRLPSCQRSANSLVCKRWLGLQDRLLRSLRLADWGFLQSGRLTSRFANLTRADLVSASLVSPRSPEVLLSHRLLSARIGAPDLEFLPPEVIDRGLNELASGCPNLRRLAVVNASELGLLKVAEECRTLQDLELYRCSDNVLRGIAACENLQVLTLVGHAEDFPGWSAVVSDLGLTILAQGCKRLVKLELGGCEGSLEGVRAIGQCCLMLEELVLSNHRFESGWMVGLACCENLKTLKLVSCKRVDELGPGVEDYLGLCSALERLHLERCKLGRDKRAVGGLFGVCGNVREVLFKDCCGLDNDVFSLATNCRRVKFVCLEGCSMLTTDRLEAVILSWKEIESLRVVSCKNIKDREISPALSTLFSLLKELKWRPDPKSSLPTGVLGTSIGTRGGRFFKRILDHKLLHFDL